MEANLDVLRSRSFGPGSATTGAKVYFDCTDGGAIRRGQVWEYDPGREILTLAQRAMGLPKSRVDEMVAAGGAMVLLAQRPAPYVGRHVRP